MKQSPIILEIKHLNVFSETLTLRLDIDGVITINHEEIHETNEFEKFIDGKWIFDNDEKSVVLSFHSLAKMLTESKDFKSYDNFKKGLV